jgi:CheY-like chemotaxis protein
MRSELPMGDQVKRVLVVDDDRDLREMIAAALRRSNLIVDEAEDGQQAMDLIAVNEYAVVLLDLMMPVVDGYAVLDRLDGDGLQTTPIVLVITGGDRAVIERAGAHRIHGVVRKPFDIVEIANVVVACAEIRERSTFGTMAIATMIAGGPFLAWFNKGF